MIGKLEKVSLRKIWQNEAKDFTTWLEKNIDALNEVLNLHLTITEREKTVGGFSLDLLAEDEQGRLAIIENQLEKTDHDHLGKLITYLTGLGAKIAIWVSSDPREEHAKAISWLNESTPADVSFYLVKIEAVRIENSAPAPLFTVVVEPTEETKELGREKKELAQRHYLRKEFWETLLEKAKEKTPLHTNVSPNIYSWIGAGAGRSGITYNYVIANDYGACELYLDRGKDFPTINKERFDQLFKNKDKIEELFGGKLEWERLDNRRASRIRIRFENIGLQHKEHWNEMQNKMIEAMMRLENAFKRFIRQLR